MTAYSFVPWFFVGILLGSLLFGFPQRLWRFVLRSWLICWKSSPADPQQFEPAQSKFDFRTARYLVELLWHWTIPFTLGCVAAALVSLIGVEQGLNEFSGALDESIYKAMQACSVSEQGAN
ncbi:hypothetical protein [Pseudomonas sp.]|uniref:hypothetical protein n=1 Tax=Pseudomonas sp. TaxID=306 RepID=UPI003A97B987